MITLKLERNTWWVGIRTWDSWVVSCSANLFPNGYCVSKKCAPTYYACSKTQLPLQNFEHVFTRLTTRWQPRPSLHSLRHGFAPKNRGQGLMGETTIVVGPSTLWLWVWTFFTSNSRKWQRWQKRRKNSRYRPLDSTSHWVQMGQIGFLCFLKIKNVS